MRALDVGGAWVSRDVGSRALVAGSATAMSWWLGVSWLSGCDVESAVREGDDGVLWLVWPAAER